MTRLPIALSSLRRFFFILLCFYLVQGAKAQQADFVFSQAPLAHILTDLQSNTSLRFFYRDALISGKTLSLITSRKDMVSKLHDALQEQQLDLRFDSLNQQVLIFELRESQQSFSLNGHVLDGESGSRLPYATVTWEKGGILQGVTTNSAGSFTIDLRSFDGVDEGIKFTISYVGYDNQQVLINPDAPPDELSIRLMPFPIQEKEVLIRSSLLQSNLDPDFHDLLSAALVAPLGEKSVMHSLQTLPSVAVNSAFSSGLNVRGSKSDGFQVLLDGSTIYNQNHFFGLFDVFNADALQNVGFYYDITPAQYQAPPGGTLHFTTRTGSLSQFSVEGGLSSTALRATIEGPLVQGKASWLISGRHSYIDGIQWLSNQKLVNQGLDIQKNISTIPSPFASVEAITLRPDNSEARFYDFHARLYHENANAARLLASFYVGGNLTKFDADRLQLRRQPDNRFLQINEERVQTENIWWNQAGSLEANHLIGARLFLRSQLSASRYYSGFRKDDFTYTRIQSNRSPRNFIFPFEYENQLLNLKWDQQADFGSTDTQHWTGGYTLQYFALNYKELSAMRPDFGEDYYAIQSDLYLHHLNHLGDRVLLNAGARAHFFTQGLRFRLSPRLQVSFELTPKLSYKLGFSRNFQFLHHLFLQNTNSPSIWIMTTGASQPSEVINLTTGLYLKMNTDTYGQVEGYIRNYDHVRRHEINAPTAIATQENDRFVPWFSDNQMKATGLEFLIRHRLYNRIKWTNSYTLSHVELSNTIVNNGLPFRAEWDRRHQFTTQIDFPLTLSLSINALWTYASGSPNPLSYDDPEEAALLPDLHRLDAGLRATYYGTKTTIRSRISFYNLYNRDNTWTRESIQVYNQEQLNSGLSFLNVDVFDLGFQPSFDVSIHF